jgi:hypothetical protein
MLTMIELSGLMGALVIATFVLIVIARLYALAFTLSKQYTIDPLDLEEFNKQLDLNCRSEQEHLEQTKGGSIEYKTK